MLRLHAAPLDTLWETLLPEAVRVLPEDLARADVLLADAALLEPFRAHWRERGPAALAEGRPTVPMQTYLRLMVLKHRFGWGYEVLTREVADSLHLRRFCRIPLHERVPDESTVRKLTRRLGPAVTDSLIRRIIALAVRERRFRSRALRVDSTVVEADVRYPTDSGLCAQAMRALARAARRVRTAVPAGGRVRDRSRAIGRRLRALGRTLGRRSGEAKRAVQRLTEEVATLLRASVREARRVATQARRSRSRATSPAARRRAIDELERVSGLADRVGEQIRRRFAGEPITERLVSLFDVDARPIRRGKLSQPTQFGYVVQVAEVTAHTRRGARGLVLPPKLSASATGENTLLAGSAEELTALGLRPREAAFDGGFGVHATAATMARVRSDMAFFIAGRADNPGSRRTRRRRARYRVGCEGRIAHLKREYGAGRSRLKGEIGSRIWEGWAVFAYDVDTAAALPVDSG